MNIKLKRKLALCVATGTLLSVHPVGAEAVSQQQDFLLDQLVVTANRIPLKLSETAANVAVVTREQIERRNYTTLAEALRDVNGVDVVAHGHPGAQQVVKLNGNDRVVILIDGRRVNLDKGSGFGRAGFELNNLATLSNVERIEVVKGAASALYGSDAVGGVINIITRKGTGSGSTLDISAGSWGQRDYQLTNQGSEGKVNWFLSAGRTYQDYFEYKDFRGGSKKMPNSRSERDSINLRLDQTLTSDSSLTFQFEHMTENSGQPGRAPGWPYHSDNAGRNTLINNYALSYNFNEGEETNGYLRFYENYFTRTFYSEFSNRSRGFDGQKTWRLDDNNLLVSGFEWRESKVDESVIYSERQKVDNQAVYLENRITLSQKWTLTPGLRYDHHNMFGGKTTPRLSANYKVDEDTNVFISWGKVFNAPNTDDLFYYEEYLDTNSGILYETKGNSNLKPETGSVATIGLNKKLSETTQLSMSYFRSRLKDAIRWDADVLNPNLYTAFNIDSQRSEGFELELRAKLSPTWSVVGSYSYLEVEDKKGDASSYSRYLKNNQPNGYRLGLDYTQEKMTANVMLRGASGRSHTNFTSSSYWLVDAGINYRLHDTARAYFKVRNLTNKAYELSGTDSIDGGPGGYPAAGRSYQVGVNYSF